MEKLKCENFNFMFLKVCIRLFLEQEQHWQSVRADSNEAVASFFAVKNVWRGMNAKIKTIAQPAVATSF